MLGACWALHNTGRAAGPGASLSPSGATSASRGTPSHGTTHHHLAEGMGFPTANTSRDCSASALLYQRSMSYTGDPQCCWLCHSRDYAKNRGNMTKAVRLSRRRNPFFSPTKLPQENTTEEQTGTQPVCKCMWLPTSPRQHLQLLCPSTPTQHRRADQSHMAIYLSGICQSVCQVECLKHSDVMGSRSVAGRKPSARHQSVPIKAGNTEHVTPGRAVLQDLD